CFRNIFDHRSETELLGIYASGNKNVKLNILEVLKPLATEVSLPFLLQEIKNEDVDICFVAVGVLCRLRSTDEIVSAFESAFEKDSPFFSVLILMLDHYLYAEFQYR
ncbi:MAG TPA: hypothetical protein VK152_02960, partial [Paludibacter sp.]|nr:hypothetical protein [Paludibacter sp.]